MIKITNHGPLIVETNYWSTDLAAGGKIYCSTNAGAIRVLLPPALYGQLVDMRTCEYCILSRGPWPEMRLAEAVELLFEDHSDSPYTLHLAAESFDLLPAEPEAGREWVLSVWTAKDGKPHKAFERICHWRKVASIPCLQPWKET